jgi:hypothetical protein
LTSGKAHNGAVIRLVFAVVVLPLLVASPSARGEDTAQPVSANGTCSVPADPQWTPQEKFVWQCVCADEVADFNKAPGYGGDLDPRKPEGWPNSRILMPTFLEAILLEGKYRTRHGVRIVGARFTQTVDLEAAQLGNDLVLDRSLLEKGMNFAGLRSPGKIALIGSKVTGIVNLEGLHINQSLMMPNSDLDTVLLSSAHVGGQLVLVGSKVTGTLGMQELRVDKDLVMREAEFATVDLSGAHVSGQLDLSSSTVTGPIMRVPPGFGNPSGFGIPLCSRADSTRQDAMGWSADTAKSDTVRLMGARVDGNLDLQRSKIPCTLDMVELQIGQSLLSHGAQFDQIVMINAQVNGQLSLSGAKITGTVVMEDVQVSSTLFLGRKSEFDGRVGFIFGKVGGNIELAGGIFHQDVDITETQIGGELRLGTSHQAPPRWSPNSTLILRDVSAGAIQDLPNAWPKKLDLTGFTYRSLGGLYAAENDPMSGRSIEWFEDWLGEQVPYTPAPYIQLAAVLRDQGKPDTADGVLYASKERERAQSPFWRNVWLSANRLLIGYGYHVERALYWSLGFWGAGIVALKLSGEGRKNGMPFGFAYSFDMLLPIIRLREKHYQIDLGCVRYYFYLHKIAGFVLASFLIAGLSGLTPTK